jgi:hypothetical protein
MTTGMARHEEQLAWERRAATPVAISSVLAGILLFQSLIVQTALREDHPGVKATPDALLSLHEHTGAYLASTIGAAIGALLLIPVFGYLFRATRYRSSELPDIFKWLVLIGPLLYAVSLVIGVVDRIDIADKFAAGLPIRGEAGADRADNLLDSPSPVIIALAFAGTLGTAFLYVMLPLRGMRAGLLSRFMGILGVIVGALLVLPLLPGGQAVIQLFWLGAFAALVLGNWPNGRGPAWETGEADPWPAPAQRRGLLGGPGAGGGDAAAAADPAPAEEPEDAPAERPASRKRRRKKR